MKNEKRLFYLLNIHHKFITYTVVTSKILIESTKNNKSNHSLDITQSSSSSPTVRKSITNKLLIILYQWIFFVSLANSLLLYKSNRLAQLVSDFTQRTEYVKMVWTPYELRLGYHEEGYTVSDFWRPSPSITMEGVRSLLQVPCTISLLL